MLVLPLLFKGFYIKIPRHNSDVTGSLRLFVCAPFCKSSHNVPSLNSCTQPAAQPAFSKREATTAPLPAHSIIIVHVAFL